MKATFRALALCGLMTFAAGTASVAVISMYAPTSVDEGGLVASVTGGWITDNEEGQQITVTVYINGWNPGTEFTLSANNGSARDTTDFCFWQEGTSKACNFGTYTVTLARGSNETKFKIETVPNFCDEGDKTIGLSLTSSSASVGTGTINILLKEDDDSAYIGRRQYHPYGGSWMTEVLEDHPCPS